MNLAHICYLVLPLVFSLIFSRIFFCLVLCLRLLGSVNSHSACSSQVAGSCQQRTSLDRSFLCPFPGRVFLAGAPASAFLGFQLRASRSRGIACLRVVDGAVDSECSLELPLGIEFPFCVALPLAGLLSALPLDCYLDCNFGWTVIWTVNLDC